MIMVNLLHAKIKGLLDQCWELGFPVFKCEKQSQYTSQVTMMKTVLERDSPRDSDIFRAIPSILLLFMDIYTNTCIIKIFFPWVPHLQIIENLVVKESWPPKVGVQVITTRIKTKVYSYAQNPPSWENWILSFYLLGIVTAKECLSRVVEVAHESGGKQVKSKSFFPLGPFLYASIRCAPDLKMGLLTSSDLELGSVSPPQMIQSRIIPYLCTQVLEYLLTPDMIMLTAKISHHSQY